MEKLILENEKFKTFINDKIDDNLCFIVISTITEGDK